MQRIYHTWDKWECFPAGFYESKPSKAITKDEAEELYASFLRDEIAFSQALNRVLNEWPNSCEHYLSNENMNRIAWLGQASMCIAHGIPSCYRGGYNLLSDDEKILADQTALKYLNKWLGLRGAEWLELESAASKTKADLY